VLKLHAFWCGERCTWQNDTSALSHIIWFIWAGQAEMRFRAGWKPLRAGQCVWLRPNGWRYDTKQNPADPLGVNFIQFDLVDDRGRVMKLPAPLPPELIDAPDEDLVGAVTRRIVECTYGFGFGGYAAPLYLTAVASVGSRLLQGVLMELDSATDPRDAHRPHQLPPAHARRILTVVMQIRENPHRVRSVAELAREFGCSASHFSRSFKAVTGIAPELYMVQTRLHRAQRLLRETTWQVGEIADACGYADIFFFSRQFKKFVGHSPVEYRRAGNSSLPK
jgi:AraC family transcriptional regulator of arabinose operon